MTEIVAASHVCRYFDGRCALDDVSIRVESGSIVGILGPNGSGKTTMMRIISGTLKRDSGDLCVLGLDPDHDGRMLRRRLGILPQDNCLDSELSVRDNVEVYGRYFGLRGQQLRRSVNMVLALADLVDYRRSPITSLSGGMQRRLSYARALMTDPDLLMLDEPTTALDPISRRAFWELIRERSRAFGTTVLLNSHFMDEAEYLCDHVAFLVNSRIVELGTPRSLVDRYCRGDVVELQASAPFLQRIRDWVQGMFPSTTELRYHSPRTIYWTCSDGYELSSVIGRYIHSVSGSERPPHQLLVRKASLEDVYVEILAEAATSGRETDRGRQCTA